MINGTVASGARNSIGKKLTVSYANGKFLEPHEAGIRTVHGAHS